MKNYLNFETDIKELETEIEKLKDPFIKVEFLRLTHKKFPKFKVT